MQLSDNLGKNFGINIIGNIDESPLHLNGIKMKNCYNTMQGIYKIVYEKYKMEFVKNFLNVLGSLHILGNPIGLINNIGQGFQDLIKKPAEGFVKGPLECGMGIIEGGGSLIKNTLTGILGSTHSITGSISSGISALTMVNQEIYL